MTTLTLLLAAITSILVFLVRPVFTVIVYIAVVAWYPSYITIPIGTIDFTLGRIIIMAIFARLFLQTDLLQKFRFIWLDKLVLIFFLCQLLAGVTTTPAGVLLENRGGAIFDMVLPYFVVRLIIITKKDYLAVLKGILVVAAPLAILGLQECLTGYNFFGFFKQYNAWRNIETYVPIQRGSFYRATETFPVSIMFGFFFAMFGPVCAGLLRVPKQDKLLCGFGIILMGLGTLSSVSSGPILAALVAMLFIVFYRWRKYWKLAAMLILIMTVSVEIISNRHFYDVIGRFTLSPGTAWYRSKLMEVALGGGMSGHWLTGFGFTDPGWSMKIDGRDHTDMVNHYIQILAQYGLLGFVPFICVVVAAIKRLIIAFKITNIESDRGLIWCLSATITGLLFSLFSVSLFGQPTTFFFITLAFCGIMPVIVNPTVRADRDICQLNQQLRH